MDLPRVSVVIPAFNGLPYLVEAYESVRSQTYPDIEICICDGGSTDGTREWIGKLPQTVRADALVPGSPPSATWTRATELATGSLIKLLCQDDLLYPSAIQQQVDDFRSHPDVTLVAGQRDVISATGAMIARQRGLVGVPEGNVAGTDILRAAYLYGTNVLGEPHTLMFRREALMQAMPWDGQRPYLLDWATYTRVLSDESCRIWVRKESVGAFRVSTSSWSTRLIPDQVHQMRQWQDEYARNRPVTFTERSRAAVAAHGQGLLRRGAYAWLRLRREMG